MSTTYKLSPIELATAQLAHQEIAKQQQILSFFLSHLVRANNLPDIEGGYTLSPDGAMLVPVRPQEPENAAPARPQDPVAIRVATATVGKE